MNGVVVCGIVPMLKFGWHGRGTSEICFNGKMVLKYDIELKAPSICFLSISRKGNHRSLVSGGLQVMKSAVTQATGIAL